MLSECSSFQNLESRCPLSELWRCLNWARFSIVSQTLSRASELQKHWRIVLTNEGQTWIWNSDHVLILPNLIRFSTFGVRTPQRGFSKACSRRSTSLRWKSSHFEHSNWVTQWLSEIGAGSVKPFCWRPSDECDQHEARTEKSCDFWAVLDSEHLQTGAKGWQRRSTLGFKFAELNEQ